MPLETIEIPRLTIQVRGPMHIGTGFARGLVNRTVVKGRDGLVYIPGSALKGKVRSACEALACLYKLGECNAPHPQQMAADHNKCLVCRIFGAPGRGSSLRWQAAHLTKDWVDALRPEPKKRSAWGQTTTRTQVQLSRTRGLAAEARLFTSEFTAEGLTFEAEPALTGRLWLTPLGAVEGSGAVYYELILLLAGLKLVGTLGGGSSRGAGECTITLPDTVTVGGQQIQVDHQLEHIGMLDLYPEETEVQP